MRASWFGKATTGLRALATGAVTIDCEGMARRFEGVPRAKILNWLLAEAGAIARPNRPWALPTHVQIEPTNRCNLQCPLCPTADGMKRARGEMSPELFRRIVDEIGDRLFVILLWDWGEPFLNPAVYDMIPYAADRGIRVITSTNGIPLAREENARRLVASRIDTVIFGVDGLTQESYEKYRRGGDLEQVRRAIRNVVAARDEAGTRFPVVNLRFIAMKHNEHEIPGIDAFARELGVDVVTIRTLLTYEDGPVQIENARGADFLPDDDRYRRFRTRDGERVRRARNACKRSWNCPAIHWDGAVVPCAFDPDDRYVLGRLGEETFREIWRGPRYRAYRCDQGRDRVPLCEDCSYAFEGGSYDEEIAETRWLRPERARP